LIRGNRLTLQTFNNEDNNGYHRYLYRTRINSKFTKTWAWRATRGSP